MKLKIEVFLVSLSCNNNPTRERKKIRGRSKLNIGALELKSLSNGGGPTKIEAIEKQ